jgi:DNA integrity scanning protein DisA with diadenylate cyclase activity
VNLIEKLVCLAEIRGNITKHNVVRIKRCDFVYLVEDIELWVSELGEMDLQILQPMKDIIENGDDREELFKYLDQVWG